MKYNIRINQKALYDNHLEGKLDMVDLVLFDFIHDFFNSVSPNKMVYDVGGERYIEIRLSLVQEQIPLLNINCKRTFINRMNKLIDAGLIERYENNQRENRSCYKRGPKWDIFTFYDTSSYSECQPAVIDLPTCENEFTPCESKFTTCENEFTPRVNLNSHNNNIIDNNIERETRAHTREAEAPNDEAIANTFLSSDMAKLMARQYGADLQDMTDAVYEVLAQWEVSEKKHADYTDRMNHLINQLRLKLQSKQNQKQTNYGIQQSFRQQERQQDFNQYAAAHEEVERRRREEQYGRDDDSGDVL